MKKKLVVLFSIAIVCAFLFSPIFSKNTQAAVNWQVTLTASLQDYTSQTILGAASDSSTGFDTAYDAIAPPLPVVGVYSYFFYPNNPTTPVDFRKLSTSVVPESPNMAWDLRVLTFGLSGNVVLTWTQIPESYNCYIKDSQGVAVLADMSKVSQYTFPSQDAITVTFVLNMVIPEYPEGIVVVLIACLASVIILKHRNLKRYI